MIIGGEELHNNHHTYPTSAKLSVKPFEFDIGWAYIRVLQTLGLANGAQDAAQAGAGQRARAGRARTLEAVIANRYEVMAQYAKQVRRVCAGELAKLRSQGAVARRALGQPAPGAPLAAPRRRQDPGGREAAAGKARWPITRCWPSWWPCAKSCACCGLAPTCRREQLVADLQAWCRKAEESGIAMLQEFSLRLRAAQAIN